MPVWFGLPFLLAGLLAAGIGFSLHQDEQRYGREGVSVSGVVIETIYEPGTDDDGPSYSIRYEFVDPATGTRHGGESSVNEDEFYASDAGDPIEVTYLPVEPTKSRIGSPEPQLLVPLAVMGMGVIFSALGGGLLVLALAIRRRPSPSAESGKIAQVSHDTTSEPYALLVGEEPPRPDAPDQPMSDAELRAIDARLAPPPPGPAAQE